MAIKVFQWNGNKKFSNRMATKKFSTEWQQKVIQPNVNQVFQPNGNKKSFNRMATKVIQPNVKYFNRMAIKNN